MNIHFSFNRDVNKKKYIANCLYCLSVSVCLSLSHTVVQNKYKKQIRHTLRTVSMYVKSLKVYLYLNSRYYLRFWYCFFLFHASSHKILWNTNQSFQTLVFSLFLLHYFFSLVFSAIFFFLYYYYVYSIWKYTPRNQIGLFLHFILSVFVMWSLFIYFMRVSFFFCFI